MPHHMDVITNSSYVIQPLTDNSMMGNGITEDHRLTLQV
jgi:hypothetical protein